MTLFQDLTDIDDILMLKAECIVDPFMLNASFPVSSSGS